MRSPEIYRHRHPLVPFIVNDTAGGFYKIPHPDLENYFFNCLANAGEEWEHLAVTICKAGKRPDRCCAWQEMCFLKEIFWQEEEAVMQLHPPRSQWINNHPFALHLWRPKKTGIPLPPSIMIGIKELNSK